MSLVKTARQNELDLLRVIAALSVFIFHYTDSFNYVNRIVPGNFGIGVFFRYGYMGVPLFFVISGYVVTMTAMNKSFAEFAISRITRLYPVFWLSCIIAFLLPRVLPHVDTFLPWPSIKALLVNCTMIPSVFDKQMINPVFWSLLEEMHFYLLITGIIIFKLWDKILPVLICWLIIYFVVSALGYSRPDDKVGILVPKHSLYFIAGMLFYLVKINYTAKWKLNGFLLVIFAFCLINAFYIARYTNLLYKSANAVSAYGFYFINLSIFFIFFLIANNKFSIRSNNVLRKLGDVTYPFYLLHLYGLGLYWVLRDTVQSQVLLLLMLVIMFCVSYAVNRYFEKPAIKYFTNIVKYISDKIITTQKTDNQIKATPQVVLRRSNSEDRE
jgi:peptidoglycan/LPS O-acetylase OafA/YrhL